MDMLQYINKIKELQSNFKQLLYKQVQRNKDKNERIKINKALLKKYKELKQPCQMINKGALCSVNGNKYEKDVHNVIKKCTINGEKFNTQNEEELAGSGSSIDLLCYNSIGIEIKKKNTPDWMQCSLKYNNKWEGSTNGKIPEESRMIFNSLLNNIKLFDNKIPPFMERKLTHSEWLKIKKNTNIWNDYYIDIPSDTIKKIYAAKGCYYIQIEDYGLYHLGNDICEFNVPEFIIEQRIRIRTKIHRKENNNGYCDLSVTAACQPKDIKKLNKSPYTLDIEDNLPLNLIFYQ
jgi:hypothetical protein